MNGNLQLNQEFLAFINYQNWAHNYEKNVLMSIPVLNAALLQSNVTALSAIAALMSAPLMSSAQACQPMIPSDLQAFISPTMPSIVERSCSAVLPSGEASSIKVKEMHNEDSDLRAAEVPENVKQNKKATIRKMIYTKDDLEKAILTIRSGRNGTRRAAIAFGIPRSTLRNHIRRLEEEDQLAGIVPTRERCKAGGRLKASRDSDMLISSTRSTSIGEESHGPASSVGKTMEVFPSAPSDGGSQARTLSVTNTSRIFPNLLDAPNPAEFLNQMISSIFHTSGDTPPTSTIGPSFSTVIDNREQRAQRGPYRYRRYSQQTMVDAIQSVRSGEMSVHRAGTHYGVPHSTLEYKVKQANRSMAKSTSSSEGSPSSSADELFSFIFEDNDLTTEYK